MPDPHYREDLNNYLQHHGGTGRLSWETYTTGPAHKETYFAVAYIDDVEYGRGQGSRRKKAMEEAARRALRACLYGEAVMRTQHRVVHRSQSAAVAKSSATPSTGDRTAGLSSSTQSRLPNIVHDLPSKDTISKSVDIIVAQLALDHATMQRHKIGTALTCACEVPDGAFLILVGFNDDMIHLGKGSLQEIYIYINFTISNDAPVLHELGKLLSPFPSTLFTSTSTHPVPILTPEGKNIPQMEFWELLENRKIFQKASDICDLLLPHSLASQDEPIQEVCRDGYGGREIATTESMSHTQFLFNNNVGRGDTGAGGGSGGSGRGSRGVSHGDGGHGVQGGDRQSRRPQGENVPSPKRPQPLPQHSGSGRPESGGGEPDPGGNETENRKYHIATLAIPLSATLEVKWNDDPSIFQRFTATSIANITIREDGDPQFADALFETTPLQVPPSHPGAMCNPPLRQFPCPSFEIEFSRLHIGTEVENKSQIQYFLCFTRIRIIATSTHPSSILDWAPDTSPAFGNSFMVTETTTRTHSGGANVAQTPGLSYGTSLASVSGKQGHKNSSTIVACPNATGTLGSTVMMWIYTIDDQKLREEGLSFQHRPRVKYSFKPVNRPHVEVEVLAYWSTRNMESSWNSHRLWSSFLLRKASQPKPQTIPVFTNFLQRVSTSLPLEGLEGHCWVDGATSKAETMKWSSVDGCSQCEDTAVLPITSKLKSDTPNIKFENALYGHVGRQTHRDIQCLNPM